MAVKEQVERILDERRLAEKKAIEDDKRRGKELGIKYREELPRVLQQRDLLLGELRRLGVVAMIEEVTERPVLPFNHEPLTQQQEEEMERRREGLMTKEGQEELRRELEETFRPKEWVAGVRYPVFSQEGLWDDTLVITIWHNPNFRQNVDPRHTPFVLVSYKYEGYLEISGAETTYSGLIPGDGSERTEVVEMALAKALVDPKIPEQPPRRCLGDEWRA